ncbi:hypothetical protein [Halorubrum sp. AJ67]|uniref:hypothetical protein n=1 Tax=Halorubrum sp. AJ67 TaxID=1173487 RepID=UPI0003DC5708|nr:hypothetical protein [Halorubrum sp. AJ67]CDK38786.1 uncharacterized protein BN903_80 [Halorubrum sp. AJ67]
MSPISEAVLAFDGPTPRVVADLRSVSFEVEHVREDVEGVYSDRDLDEAYQLVMSNQITGDDFKELIGESRYNAQTLFFDDVIVFLFPADRYDAIFASFDYDGAFPVNELVDAVAEARATE